MKSLELFCMGEHEEWAQPPTSGLLPNGLLPNEAASVMRVLDSERWSKAEERTTELIARIQPNLPSEDRRNAVADYVQRLITKCFPCEVGHESHDALHICLFFTVIYMEAMCTVFPL